MKNYAKLSAALIFLISGCTAHAGDVLQFDFPDAGWHKTPCIKEYSSAVCYSPHAQNEKNYREMLIFYSGAELSENFTALDALKYELDNDKSEYKDIIPKYVSKKQDDAIAVWCSKFVNTCALRRVFKGAEGAVSVLYLNRMPHYSQNIVPRWTNILSAVKLHTDNGGTGALIELN